MKKKPESARLYLIALRDKKDLKQHEIAEKIGISRSHYTNIELGVRDPKLKEAEMIADFFKEKDMKKLFRKGGIVLANGGSNKD